jgi:O-antigen/teichoic acid export membrane protein
MVVSTVAVGMYSNYLNLSQKLLLMEQILFSSMTASIGNVIAKEDADKKYKVFQAVQSLSLILCGIITSSYYILATDFVGILYGKEFVLPEIVVVAVTINAYFSCALQPLWIYRDATGLYRKIKYVMLLATIENIVLSVILGRIMGIAGVILASAIARLTTYCWYEPRLLFREYFDRTAGNYFVQMLLNVLLCVSSIVAIGAITSFITVSGWPDFVLKALITGGLSALVFMLAYAKTQGAQSIIDKVKSFIKR